MASEYPTDRPKWLPFALFAFRTRVHTTTKFAPFALTFGRKAYGFDDWNTTNNEIMSIEESVMLKAKKNK